jgi:hypothetical protein
MVPNVSRQEKTFISFKIKINLFTDEQTQMHNKDRYSTTEKLRDDAHVHSKITFLFSFFFAQRNSRNEKKQKKSWVREFSQTNLIV